MNARHDDRESELDDESDVEDSVDEEEFADDESEDEEELAAELDGFDDDGDDEDDFDAVVELTSKEQNSRSLEIRRAIEERLERRRLSQDVDYLDFEDD